MSDEPKSRGTSGLLAPLPTVLTGPDAQNPAPFDQEGQVDESRVRTIADQIVRVFLNSLPSNYVSQTKGPYYAQQFQAAAEELARIQVAAEDAYEDVDFDFTRSEVLWQFLATLVFPWAQETGLPDIQGDVSFRTFLKTMVALLLKGSKEVTLLQGVEALTDAEVSIIDRSLYSTTLNDRFTFDINVSKHRRTTVWDDTTASDYDHYHTVSINAAGEGKTTGTVWTGATGPAHTHEIAGFLTEVVSATGLGAHTHDLLSSFPDLPTELARNVRLVMRVLKPAHTLYEYANLFRETYRQVFADEVHHHDLDSYYYDDLRKYCTGIKEVGSSSGTVLSDRYTLNDTVSFRAVRPGAPLRVFDGSGLVLGTYQVREVLAFPFGDDPVARPYTTAPSVATGTATVVSGAIVDPARDWAVDVVAGEVLTFTSGPNAGDYILETVLGSGGGALGTATGPGDSVSPAPCFVRVAPRFPAAVSVIYSIEVDRLGVRTPIQVTNEDVSSQFYSPPVGNNTTVIVARGPLVRNYGDATPATPLDVAVELNGVPQTVESVNPYTGEITLAAPGIPRFLPASGNIVKVYYSWFPMPLQGMTGLNTKGLTLNKWDFRSGRTATSPTSGGLWGGFRTTRFPMGVALGRFPTRKPPVRVAHRYIAFERAYTAAINSPTTLLLNQAPGRITVPYAEADVPSTTVQYEGTSPPTAPWVQKGALAGVSNGDFYTLTKTSGTEVGYWGRDFELPVASIVGAATRIQIDSYTLDGVFTGIGLGFHDNQRLYLAGALVVNGVRHIGLLARPGNLSDLTSWIVGPQVAGRVATSATVTCSLSDAPTLLTPGDRFQILSGNQTGIYTISQVFRDRPRNRLTLQITGAFPANPALFGNRDVSLVFETLWDEAVCSWRIYANTRSQTAQVYFGGSTGGGFARLTASPVLASPAYLGPDVLPQGSGRFVWGTFSRAATSEVVWDFVRYLSTPDGGTRFSRGTVIDTTMTENPEDTDWYVTTPWGDSAVGGGILRLTSTPGNANLDASYGYAKVDPFLNGRRVVALDAKLTATRDTSAAGGAALSISDPYREARLGTLLYQDNGGAGKQLFPQPVTSLIGAVPFADQAWTATGTPSAFSNGPETLLSGDDSAAWSLGKNLPFTNGSVARTLEFRLAVPSYSLGVGGNTGLVFTATANGRLIGISFSGPDFVDLVDLSTPAVLFSIPFAWSDGEPHTYRVEIDPTGDSVDLYVDDVIGGSVLWSAFPALVGAPDVSVRNLPESGSAFAASLESLTLLERLDGIPNLDRTFGLWRGGDPADIDNWEIPRSDGNAVPNSDPLSVLVPMDWSAAECWVRVFVDPTFGAVFLRPDQNPPLGYTGNFATQSLDPTAAWAKIEYSRLPRSENTTRFGVTSFGALNPAASSLSFWNEVRYRVFTHTSVDYRAPQRMALNQWNVITSGDYLKDVTPEQVILASLTPTRVSLRPGHIFADRVFQVIVEGVPVPPEGWRFNQDSQEVILFTALPSAGYPVTVVFAPAKPITTTYLQTQPLPESQTILNEGTPPVPLGRIGQATASTVSGDGGPTPAFPPAGPGNPNYFLRDQYLVRQFADDPDTLYEQMQFFQLEDGGSFNQISSVCDAPGNGGGLNTIGLSGAMFFELLGGPTLASRRPGYSGGALTSGTFLHASGGAAGVLGVLGPALYSAPFTGPNPAPTGVYPAMLWPSYPADGTPGAGTGAIWREVQIVLRLGASPGSVLSNTNPVTDVPLIEGTISAPIFGSLNVDQKYASQGPAIVSPSVLGSETTGVVWAKLQNGAAYTRVGPWGGATALALNSLLYGSSAIQPSGVPSSGSGFTPNGGSPLPNPPAPVVSLLG